MKPLSRHWTNTTYGLYYNDPGEYEMKIINYETSGGKDLIMDYIDGLTKGEIII
jgi:hypothetical protein